MRAVLKVKLSAWRSSASASIHLLKTFINPDQYSEHSVMMWQTILIHVAFLASALIMAWPID